MTDRQYETRAPASATPTPSADADPESWLELYGDSLYRFALGQLRGDEALAEDLVQETFLSAMRALDRFEGRSAVQTWLTSILKNKIIDHFRKRSRQGHHVQIEEVPEGPLSGIGALGLWNVYVPNWAKDPEAILENEQFLGAVQSCLGKLPDRSRELFQLKFLKQLETDEICNILEISSSNFWVLLHRGRLALRQCVEDNWHKSR